MELTTRYFAHIAKGIEEEIKQTMAFQIENMINSDLTRFDFYFHMVNEYIIEQTLYLIDCRKGCPRGFSHLSQWTKQQYNGTTTLYSFDDKVAGNSYMISYNCYDSTLRMSKDKIHC